MYVLILTVLSVWADGYSAITHVPGFATEEDCLHAASLWRARTENTGTKLRFIAVCAPQNVNEVRVTGLCSLPPAQRAGLARLLHDQPKDLARLRACEDKP